MPKFIDLNEYGWEIHAISITEKAQAEALPPIIKKYFDPKSVIDIGAGPGIYAWAIRDQLGIEVHAVDGCPAAVNYGPVEVHDLREPYYPPRKFDLCISLEVLEHIESDYAEAVVGSIARCADTALVTAAQPGQGGHFHVNEQPLEYWISRFHSAGMEYDESLTHTLRGEFAQGEAFRQHAWMINNTMVFRKMRYAPNDFIRAKMYEKIGDFLTSFVRTMEPRHCKLLEVGANDEGIIVKILRQARINFSEVVAKNYPDLDIQNLPGDFQERFDFVVADQVLEHVQWPWIAAQEMYRVLVPSGIAISLSPFIFPIHRPECPDCWRITQEGYRALFEWAGFEVVHTDQWGTIAAQRWAFQHNLGDLSFIPVEDARERGFFEEHEKDGLFPIVVWCVARKPK